MERINNAIKKQSAQIEKGRAVDTGISAEQFAAASSASVAGYGLNAIDQNTYKTAVHPALTREQVLQLIGRDPTGQTKVSGGPGGLGVARIKEERRVQQQPQPGRQ